MRFTYVLKTYQENVFSGLLFVLNALCLLSKSSESVLAFRELICLTDGRNSLSDVEFGL